MACINVFLSRWYPLYQPSFVGETAKGLSMRVLDMWRGSQPPPTYAENALTSKSWLIARPATRDAWKLWLYEHGHIVTRPMDVRMLRTASLALLASQMKVLAAIAATALAVSGVNAWGDKGHQAVGYASHRRVVTLS